MQPAPLPRVASIDILRALTMLLMIFVNDLGNVAHAPEWLDHTKKMTDGMGLADSVFPAFLVIVGMSLPFAMESRKRKGDSRAMMYRHIAERSFALIVMGVFLVNGESLNEAGTGMAAGLYNTLACLSFIFIWNAFPPSTSKILVNSLKIIGWIILAILAWIYRGGEEEIHRFATSWWGILGLIGWSYLLCSIVFVAGKEKLSVMIGLWILCMLLSIAGYFHWIPHNPFIGAVVGPIGHGGLACLVAMGCITSLLFIREIAKDPPEKVIGMLLVLAAGLMLAGFGARHYFIISKILATPSWVLICSGITIAVFALIYWIADVRHLTAWATIIKPAGTNTLLCYLLPYFAYALIAVLGVSLPDPLVTGGLGLLKTFCFALLTVVLAGQLMKLHIRLKL